MDILLIDEKIRKNLNFSASEEIEEREEIDLLEKLLKQEFNNKTGNSRKIENKINEKKERKLKKKISFKISFLIEKYKMLLLKPTLRSDEERKEKSDIIEEYIKKVNSEYKKYFYHSHSNKINIIKEYLELVKNKPIYIPAITEFTLKENEKNKINGKPLIIEGSKIMKKEKFQKELKKSDRYKKDKYYRDEKDSFLKKYFEGDDKYLEDIDFSRMLYYYIQPQSLCKICENCKGINLIKEDIDIICQDCGYIREEIHFVSTPSDLERVCYK